MNWILFSTGDAWKFLPASVQAKILTAVDALFKNGAVKIEVTVKTEESLAGPYESIVLQVWR